MKLAGNKDMTTMAPSTLLVLLKVEWTSTEASQPQGPAER